MSDAAPSPLRRALICGVGGQDGAYLARFLLGKGYEVFGTSRDAASMTRLGLKTLEIEGQVQVVSMAPNDFRSVLKTVTRVAPDEIYNLGWQAKHHVEDVIDAMCRAGEAHVPGNLTAH